MNRAILYHVKRKQAVLQSQEGGIGDEKERKCLAACSPCDAGGRHEAGPDISGHGQIREITIHHWNHIIFERLRIGGISHEKAE